MKKLFALLAVFCLAAVGCQDSKTSNKPTNVNSSGGTFEKKDTVRVEGHTTVVNTVVHHTATITDTKTGVKTVDVKTPEKAPTLPGDKGKDGGK